MKQPKKIKSKRKKERDKFIEKMTNKYEVYFADLDKKTIRDICNAFRLSGKKDDEFPMFIIEWESNHDAVRSLINNKDKSTGGSNNGNTNRN